MKANHVIVQNIERAYCLRDCMQFRIALMPRGEKTHCGRCGRGIVIEWPMGYEPTVRTCRVCGAETNVQIIGMLSSRQSLKG